MNNTTIINILNSDNINITNIKTQYCQVMTTITNITLKFKPMIKKPIVADNTFLLLLLLITSVSSLKAILS